MSSTLPISKTAWLDSWLNIMFSFARSSRIHFCSNQFWFCVNRFCTSLCDFFSFTASACKNALRSTSILPRWVSTSMFEVVCLSFLVARSASVEWSVTSCAPAWSPLFDPCFHRLGTSVPEVECCGCGWLCHFFFHVTLGADLGVSSLSKSTRSASWEVTRSIQRYRSVSHDYEWFCLPAFQSLILRF